MEGLTINDGNGGWNGGLGALVGGLVGGAVGSAWNGNRWNGPHGDGSCCSGGGTSYVMDTLTGLQSDVNSIGRDQLMQSASGQSTMCQGFGGVNATVERTAAAGQLTATQGFAGLNTAITSASLQTQLALKDVALQNLGSTNAITSAISNCCCQTNANISTQGCEIRNAIHAEGEATRAMLAMQEREQLIRERNQAETRAAILEQQIYQSNLAQASVAQVLAKLPASTTTTTTPTA